MANDVNDEDLGGSPVPDGEPADAEHSVTHTNRKGDVYHLHPGTTRTGATAYRFSRKADGDLVSRIPKGYEVREHPDGRVFLRKARKRVIIEVEERIVREALRNAGATDAIVDVQKNSITVYMPDLDEEIFEGFSDVSGWISELLGKFEETGFHVPDEARDILAEAASKSASAFERKSAEALKKVQTYSPMLRFTLVDAGERSFEVERACFRGPDEWKWLDGQGDLGALAKRYCKHLGKDSFYEL